jgi:hypothetical protein
MSLNGLVCFEARNAFTVDRETEPYECAREEYLFMLLSGILHVRRNPQRKKLFVYAEIITQKHENLLN